MKYKLVLLVLALVEAQRSGNTVDELGNVKDTVSVGGELNPRDSGKGLLPGLEKVATSESADLGNVLGTLLFGEGVRISNGTDGKNPNPPTQPNTGPRLTIDWNEIGFSFFNGRVFPTGSADMKKVLNTRSTIAAILRIETFGLSGNAKLNLSARRVKGKSSVVVKIFSIPLCDLPAFNRKALSLTLGLKYLTLPNSCPLPPGVFTLAYFYKSRGIDFFKGFKAGDYKIDFTITEDENVFLSFFWRVVITAPKKPRKAKCCDRHRSHPFF